MQPPHDQYDIYGTGNPPTRLPAQVLTTALAYLVRASIVEYLAFANNSGSAVTVTVEDGSGNAYLPAATIQPNTLQTIEIPEGGLYFANGLQASASINGVVSAWLRSRVAS